MFKLVGMLPFIAFLAHIISSSIIIAIFPNIIAGIEAIEPSTLGIIHMIATYVEKINLWRLIWGGFLRSFFLAGWCHICSHSGTSRCFGNTISLNTCQEGSIGCAVNFIVDRMFLPTLRVLALIVAISKVETKFKYQVWKIITVEPFTRIIAWNLSTEELLYVWSLNCWCLLIGFILFRYSHLGSDINTSWTPCYTISMNACKPWVVHSTIMFMPVWSFPLLAVPTLIVPIVIVIARFCVTIMDIQTTKWGTSRKFIM